MDIEAASFHRMHFGDAVASTLPKLGTNGRQSKMFHGLKRKDWGEEKETFQETTKRKAEAENQSRYNSRCSDLVMDIDHFTLPGPCRYECGTSTKFVSRTVQYKAAEKTQVRKRSRAKNQETGYSEAGNNNSLFRRLDAHVLLSTIPDLPGCDAHREASENDSIATECSTIKLREFGDIELLSLPGPSRYECGTATKFVSRKVVSKAAGSNGIKSKSLNSGHPTPFTPSSFHKPASMPGKLTTTHEFHRMDPQTDVAQTLQDNTLKVVTPEIFYEATFRLIMEHDPLKLQPKKKKRYRGHRYK